MTKKDKELIGFFLLATFALLDAVAFELIKGTATKGVIMIVLGLLAISFLTIGSVKSLVQKEWGAALVFAALAGIFVRLLWTDWLNCPWDQLPQEIDMIVNFYKSLWIEFDSAGINHFLTKGAGN